MNEEDGFMYPTTKASDNSLLLMHFIVFALKHNRIEYGRIQYKKKQILTLVSFYLEHRKLDFPIIWILFDRTQQTWFSYHYMKSIWQPKAPSQRD